jgi:phytoene dehydrogenase-like protein
VDDRHRLLRHAEEQKTLPDRHNCYMVGQWVEPGGGLPPAATSGRGIAQILCKRDGKKFETKST